MIKRIVKLTLRPDAAADFEALFQTNRATIAAQPGCYGVDLLRVAGPETIYFTWSRWESEAHLNQYRRSAFFGTVWKPTKALFAAPAEAWTVVEVG